MDLTTSPQFQITTSGYYTQVGIFVKTAGGSYTPPSAPFSSSTIAPPPQNTLFSNITCNPTCNITPPASTAGDAAMINVIGPGTLSSASGRGTFTVPTGGGTCQNTTVNDISCAHIENISSSFSAITLTMTTNGTYSVSFVEFATAIGSFAFDTQGSSNSSVSTSTVTGQTPTISGSPDICVQQITWSGSAVQNAVTLYPQPGGADILSTTTLNGVLLVLQNTTNTTAPQVILSGSAANNASSYVCVKHT